MKNKILKSGIGLAGSAALLLGFAFPVLAATAGVNTSTSANVPGGANVNGNLDVSANALSRIITASDTAINNRIDALNKLSTRISSIKNVSDSEKSSVSAEVQAQISTLTTLKAKIDADTDATVAKADAKTITGNYRIYALIIPQGYVVASSDRILTIVGLMTTMQTKLQTRITTAQSSGKDVTALNTAMTDMSAKLSDATSKAQAAASLVASLSPDQGNATVAASNKAALVSARADIKTGVDDLKAARADIKVVVQGLK